MQIFKSAGMLNMPSIKLSQFYGIELDDFAHEVAILSLWLTEHQMNMEFIKEFGDCTPTLPLKDGGNIVQGNATRLEWSEVCPKGDGDEIYVLGNPPYLGARLQNKIQKEDMAIVFKEIKGFSNLDYITCWFYKGTKYIKSINARLAFVSTNSINQGEQVSLLWSHIFNEKIEIQFAHLSFKWSNNAKSNAGVTVSIVGLSNESNKSKFLYQNGLEKEVKKINAYLVSNNNIIVQKSIKSISNLPLMSYGSMPNDDGNLICSVIEKNNILEKYQSSSILFKKFIGASEFINGIEKYCLWITNENYEFALSISEIKERIQLVKKFRLNSKRFATNKLADTPHRFGEIRHKNTNSIIIPQTTSEKRSYIPIGFCDANTIISNAGRVIYNAENWIFGILTSKMHNNWVQSVSGRLETRIQYSSTLCYNTFPFPKITQKQKDKIEELVHLILDERDKNFPKTMAELYDPNKMPEGLKEAHHNLDMYIEKCYRDKPFESDEERLEYLFRLYEKMIKEEVK
jgi:hypothetical protein